VYYGDPLPVLLHEPFNREKPWTWLRRHPQQMRMDEKGQVTQGNIRRYRRQTVEQMMQKAKERSSVITVISTGDENDSMCIHV